MKIYISCLCFAILLNSCSSKSNPSSTIETSPTFPHTYHGSSAYFAGDTLGTDFGVAITTMTITRADSVFNANGLDSISYPGFSETTPFIVVGEANDQSKLHYNVAFDDGSTGVAVFNSDKKGSLTITLESFLTTKFGTSYDRVYTLNK